MNKVASLTWVSIALLAIPVAGVIGLSVAMGLGQVKRISIATVRSLVQLVAVGLVIESVFSHASWYWVLLLLMVMTLIAAFTAASQVGVRIKGLPWLMSLILGGVTAMTLFYLIRAVVGEGGWDPRYWIPFGGMLLGNAMTAATLAVERLGSELVRSDGDVEVYLALGGSPWQAMHPALRQAVSAALTPTINAMMVVGIVKLPGMMTGQMLGGTKPFQAALYQFLILIGILFCTSIAAALSGALLYRRFFTPAWQLNREVLRRFRK